MLRDPIAVPFPVDQLMLGPHDFFQQSGVFMPTATLTSQGRITLPQGLRQARGLHAGTKIDFVAVADGFEIVPVKKEATLLKGRFAGRNDCTVCVEAMDEATASDAPARPTAMKILA